MLHQTRKIAARLCRESTRSGAWKPQVVVKFPCTYRHFSLFPLNIDKEEEQIRRNIARQRAKASAIGGSAPTRLSSTELSSDCKVTQDQKKRVPEAAFEAHIWSEEEVNSVRVTHDEPKDLTERIAYGGVKLLRFGFDVFSGYRWGKVNDERALRRLVFLETVAGIPGMVASSLRHLKSLRRLENDDGWILTLLKEAENERIHALIFCKIRQNGFLFRLAVWFAQGIFWNVFFFSYLISPRLCHSFVKYLEEEAVITYTHVLDLYDAGDLPKIAEMQMPPLARDYWQFDETATMRDVLLQVRRDEANHREVNRTLAKLRDDEPNPCAERWD